MRTLAGAAVALVVLSACGEDNECMASYQDAGADPAAVCQVDIDEETGQCFRPPQICPDLSPVNLCQRVVGEDFNVNISLANAGQEPLVIDSISVLGDERCAFVSRVDVDVGEPIRAGAPAVLRVTYTPSEEAEDFVFIRINSNAENLPVLDIPFCGRGVAPGAPAGACEPAECRPPTREEVIACG